MGSNLLMSLFLHDFDLCHRHNHTVVFVFIDSLVVYVYKPEIYLIIKLENLKEMNISKCFDTAHNFLEICCC